MFLSHQIPHQNRLLGGGLQQSRRPQVVPRAGKQDDAHLSSIELQRAQLEASFGLDNHSSNLDMRAPNDHSGLLDLNPARQPFPYDDIIDLASTSRQNLFQHGLTGATEALLSSVIKVLEMKRDMEATYLTPVTLVTRCDGVARQIDNPFAGFQKLDKSFANGGHLSFLTTPTRNIPGGDYLFFSEGFLEELNQCIKSLGGELHVNNINGICTGLAEVYVNLRSLIESGDEGTRVYLEVNRDHSVGETHPLYHRCDITGMID